MRKLVVAVVTCALALLAIVALLLATLDLGRYRGLIEAQASRAIGREVAITGELSLGLSLRPTLVASGVTIANPGWASRPHLAAIARVEAAAAALPLLAGRMEIERIALTGADVALERASDGRGNWQGLRLGGRPLFVSTGGPSLLVRSAQAAEPSADSDMPGHFVGRIEAGESRVTYRDQGSGRTIAMALGRATLATPDARSPIAVSAAGELDGGAFELEGELGAFGLLLGRAEAYPVDLDARWQGLEIRVEGDLLPGADPGLDLHVAATAADAEAVAGRLAGLLPQLALAGPSGPLRLDGRIHGSLARPAAEDLQARTRLHGVDVTLAGDVTDLRAFSGIGLAVSATGDPVGLRDMAPTLPIGSFSASGYALGAAKALELRGLRLRLGRTDLAGELTLLRHGERPKLVGRLSSRRVSLPVGAGWQEAGAAFDLAALRVADVDVRVETDLLQLGPVEARQASLDVRLDAGVLSLDRLRASLTGAPVEGFARLDASGDEPRLALRLDAAPVDLHQLMAQIGRRDLLSGRAELRLDLAMRGLSAGDWRRTLDGSIEASVGDGALGGALVRPLMAAAPSLEAAGQDLLPLDCLELGFDIADGIATVRSMLADSTAASARGEGTIDLDAASYALLLTLTPRAGAPGPAVPLRISGPLDSPEIALGAPAGAEGLGALLFPPAAAATADHPGRCAQARSRRTR